MSTENRRKNMEKHPFFPHFSEKSVEKRMNFVCDKFVINVT